MNGAMNEFIERTHKLTRSGSILAAGITGGSNKQSLMMDLYKEASLLPKAKAENKLNEQIDQVVGVLHVAQAMNVLALSDLEELMTLLEKIDKE